MTANTLFYLRPAQQWLDGLPLGNGRLGAMVLPGPGGLRLQVNDSTAWSGSPDSEHRLGQVEAADAAQALAAAREALGNGRPVDAERLLEPLQSRYSQAYLPFADVLLSTSADELTAGAGGRLRRELHLDDGVHTTEQEFPGGASRQDTFISAADGVLVHRLTSTVPLDVSIRLTTPLRELSRHAGADAVGLELRLPADVAPGHAPEEPPLRWEADGVRPVEGAVHLALTHNGTGPTGTDPNSTPAAGGSPAPADLVLTGVTELLLVLATATTFTAPGQHPDGTAADCHSAASRQAAAALDKGFDELLSGSVQAHRLLFNRTELTLLPGPQALPDRSGVPTDVRIREANRFPAGPLAADPELAVLLFAYGRYLLICSSRPDSRAGTTGALPATLQGIWNEDMQPPWSSNYTLNINLQMNYWGAHAADLAECTEPLLELVEALADRGRSTAATLYGARGWVAHHNTDAWAFTSPTAGDASWAHWPMAGPWLVRQLDEGRRFGAAGSADLLRIWNLAVGCAEFLCDWLLDDGGPWLQTRPSTSPENTYQSAQGPAALASSSAMDRTLITELFDVVLSLAPLTGQEDHPVVAEVRRALPGIAPPAIGNKGGILEWGPAETAVDPLHRHLSHLSFLYPGNGGYSFHGVYPDRSARTGSGSLTPELAAAARTSLDGRGDDSTGWSLVWKICLRARLGQAEKVSDLLRLLFREAGTGIESANAGSGVHAGGLYPNLFTAHPPFQLDANLGYVAALTETLLQSHAGVIRLLPALPAEFAFGQVRGLVARPGITVDLTWNNGRLTSATLTARTAAAAGPQQIEVHGARQTVHLEPGRGVSLDLPKTPDHMTEPPAQLETT
ncbi:glycosyl hydrolase family 95 catalytic domain-containing protein [Arthrobacter sp. NPDC097144]|uniref:glycosyl hydrolase family 95 catalytic domain-containing protein n=1 Tax=Arthrobacter sp. NPDC097144 TaxID=3363946 RepID=UPI00382E5ED2